MKQKIIVVLLTLMRFITSAVFGQEQPKITLLFPFGYDFIRLGEQTIHSPSAGTGFLLGEMDLPFTEVERRFFGLALYRPFFLSEEPQSGVTRPLHRIDAIFDGRINRHQILFIFKSTADKPIAGGLNTFQAGAGWGYELIRQDHVSLILGAVAGVSDFGITLPSGAVWPLLPLPLVRFGIDTQWFVSSFDFLTGPKLSFTVAPKEKIRFTADMRMDKYRNIDDLICEFTLWYRFFSADHLLGDFAGIGFGIKNDMYGFDLSNDLKVFELQQKSVFASIDLSILSIQGGWIFDSNYIVDNKKTKNPGKGFFISVQGIIPVKR
ncbi:MAG: hypothetical protein FWG07_05635 [Treponema sp.]|nr:hypothetical protein [Treponema sp.]